MWLVLSALTLYGLIYAFARNAEARTGWKVPTLVIGWVVCIFIWAGIGQAVGLHEPVASVAYAVVGNGILLALLWLALVRWLAVKRAPAAKISVGFGAYLMVMLALSLGLGSLVV